MRIASLLFWVCCVGTLFNLLAMTVTSSVAALAGSSSFFVLGALGFAVGAVSNYFVAMTPRRSKGTK